MTYRDPRLTGYGHTEAPYYQEDGPDDAPRYMDRAEIERDRAIQGQQIDAWAAAERAKMAVEIHAAAD